MSIPLTWNARTSFEITLCVILEPPDWKRKMPAQMSPFLQPAPIRRIVSLLTTLCGPRTTPEIVEVGDRPVLDRHVRMAVVGDPSGPGRARIRAVDRVTVEIDRDAVRTHDEAVHGTVDEVVRERRALRQGLAAGDRRAAMGTERAASPERPPEAHDRGRDSKGDPLHLAAPFLERCFARVDTSHKVRSEARVHGPSYACGWTDTSLLRHRAVLVASHSGATRSGSCRRRTGRGLRRRFDSNGNAFQSCAKFAVSRPTQPGSPGLGYGGGPADAVVAAPAASTAPAASATNNCLILYISRSFRLVMSRPNLGVGARRENGGSLRLSSVPAQKSIARDLRLATMRPHAASATIPLCGHAS